VWIGRLDQSLGEVRSHLKEQGQPHEMPHLSFDLAKADYPEDILVFCAYTHLINELRPLFQGEFAHLDNLNTAAILRSVLDAKLPLVPTIRQGIDQFKQQSFGATTIGVHVRYTDIKVPLEKLIAKVQQVARQHTDPVIFLATDSAAVIDQFQAQFPRLAMIDKWFPPEGQRLHQNWDNCPSRYDNGVEALTDLFLLAECDRLVFSSKSSFGYVASLLSRAGDHHIFDIELEGSWMRRVARKSQALLKILSVKG
ncbi:MAG TPA: nodulation protein NodZ, partial [Candidatus Obscuribacterales bacterium]